MTSSIQWKKSLRAGTLSKCTADDDGPGNEVADDMARGSHQIGTL